MAKQQFVNKEGRWQDWFNLVLGAWLIVAPFIGLGVNHDVAAWNSYASGAVVAVFAIAAIARPHLWEEWLNLIVGLWLIIAPFALHFTVQSAPMWNQIIVGLLIGIDALWAGAQMWARHRHA
jgi:uncharacterized membrane protein HdeD (DUF308 family)